jgi:hypothetical protein
MALRGHLPIRRALRSEEHGKESGEMGPTMVVSIVTVAVGAITTVVNAWLQIGAQRQRVREESHRDQVRPLLSRSRIVDLGEGRLLIEVGTWTAGRQAPLDDNR